MGKRGARTPSPRLPLFSLRLSSATKSRWREAAEREGRTLAGYIKHAVEDYFSRMQAQAQADSSTPTEGVWLYFNGRLFFTTEQGEVFKATRRGMEWALSTTPEADEVARAVLHRGAVVFAPTTEGTLA